MAQSHKTSYGFLASCQNLEKTNNTFPRKCHDRRKDGEKDLFYRILPATAGGPKMQVMAAKHLKNYNVTAKIIQYISFPEKLPRSAPHRFLHQLFCIIFYIFCEKKAYDFG